MGSIKGSGGQGEESLIGIRIWDAGRDRELRARTADPVGVRSVA
jgi:hypothetical protein